MTSESNLLGTLNQLKAAVDLGLHHASPRIRYPLMELFPLTDVESESPLPVAEVISDKEWFWDLLHRIALNESVLWYRTLVKAILVHADPEGLVNIGVKDANYVGRALNLKELADAVRARSAGDYKEFIALVDRFCEPRSRHEVSVIQELMLEAYELAESEEVISSIMNLFGHDPVRFLPHLRRLHYQAGLVKSFDFCKLLHSGISAICKSDNTIKASDLWQEIYSVDMEYISRAHQQFSKAETDPKSQEKWLGFREFLNVKIQHPTMTPEITLGLASTDWLENKTVENQISAFTNQSDNFYYAGLCRYAQVRILREMVSAWSGSKADFISKVQERAAKYCPLHSTSGDLARKFVQSFLIESSLNPDSFAMNRFGTQTFLRLSYESRQFRISSKAMNFLTRNGALPLLPWQQSALTSWVAHGRQGLISAATGTGKSRLGIAAILEAYEDGMPVVLLTHRLAIKGQWKKDELMSIAEADIHGYELASKDRYFKLGENVVELSSEDHYNPSDPPAARAGRVLIALDKSLADRPHLLPYDEPGLLVADEVHQFNDPTGWKILNGNFSRRLGMSATISGLEDYGLLPHFGGVKVADYGLGKATRDKVICEYNLLVIRVPYMPIRGFGVTYQNVNLTSKSKPDEHFVTEEELLDAERKVAVLLGELTDPEKGIPYGVDENFDEVLDRVILAKHPEFMAPAKKYLRERSEYNRLARQFKSQLSVLELLKTRIRDHGKTLVFSNTKVQGKEFRDELELLGVPTIYIDSDTEQHGRKDAFKALERNQTKALVSPQILDEGVNIPSAQIGIFLGTGNGKYRQIVQRMGRVLRKKPDSQEALIIVAVGMHTREDPGIDAARIYPDSQFGIMKKFANDWRIVDYEDGASLDQALEDFL
ncbi:SF2_C_XPB domain containing protein [Candidatus Nanopelagicaceae bacterium]